MENMKIEIKADQPLDEVVMELERLGHRINSIHKPSDVRMLETWEDGAVLDYRFFSVRDDLSDHELTTLQQLREMK